MKNRAIRKKSTHFKSKVNLRLKAIQNLENIRVLDLYHGDGLIWEYISRKRAVDVVGIEQNDSSSPFECYKGDNIEVVEQIDLNSFNVFDFDAYTNPVDLMNKVLPKLKNEAVIIYTFCMNRISGVAPNISQFKEIQKKCKTITNKFFEECWKNYLFEKGIEEYHEITFTEGFVIKKYGYFVYKP